MWRSLRSNSGARGLRGTMLNRSDDSRRKRRHSLVFVEALEGRQLLSTAYDDYLSAVTNDDATDQSTVTSDYATYQ